MIPLLSAIVVALGQAQGGGAVSRLANDLYDRNLPVLVATSNATPMDRAIASFQDRELRAKYLGPKEIFPKDARLVRLGEFQLVYSPDTLGLREAERQVALMEEFASALPRRGAEMPILVSKLSPESQRSLRAMVASTPSGNLSKLASAPDLRLIPGVSMEFQLVLDGHSASVGLRHSDRSLQNLPAMSTPIPTTDTPKVPVDPAPAPCRELTFVYPGESVTLEQRLRWTDAASRFLGETARAMREAYRKASDALVKQLMAEQAGWLGKLPNDRSLTPEDLSPEAKSELLNSLQARGRFDRYFSDREASGLFLKRAETLGYRQSFVLTLNVIESLGEHTATSNAVDIEFRCPVEP